MESESANKASSNDFSEVPPVNGASVDTVRERFNSEMGLFTFVYNGNVNKAEACAERIIEYICKADETDTELVRFNAIAYLSIICRVAMSGGILYSDAYRINDSFISSVSQMDSTEAIIDAFKASVHELVTKVYDAANSADYSVPVQQTINHIANNLTGKITLSQLSELTGLTTSYLSSLFKKETGLSLSYYITREKLRGAAQYIASHKMTSIEASKHFGFCSQSYFCKCFKEFYNLTPSEFAMAPTKVLFTYKGNKNA